MKKIKIVIFCLCILLTAVVSFFGGAYLQAKQYEEVFVKPYLAEITRSQIYNAILLREGIVDPLYSENYGLGYLVIADGLEMKDEHTLKLVKSYSEKYQVDLSLELKALLEPYESFEIAEKMIDGVKQSLLAGKERNYSVNLPSIPAE